MTIQQIQQQINKKTNDPRQLINMIADYLQANPGGGSPGGSSYLPLHITENTDVDIDQDKFIAFNGAEVSAGPNIGQIPNFTISADEGDMWIGSEFYDNDVNRSDLFIDNQEMSYSTTDNNLSTVFSIKKEGVIIDFNTGQSGSFVSQDGKTITVVKGIITAITP